MDLKTVIRYVADHYEINEDRKSILLNRVLKAINKKKQDGEHKQPKGEDSWERK